MFMHMPRRWGVLVLIVAAVCLGAYYVMVVGSERAGDWRLHQGSGRVRVDAGGMRYLDMQYTVIEPGKSLLSYVRLERTRCDSGSSVLVLRYQSDRPTVLVVGVTERDGSRYQARLELEATEAWRRLELGAGRFGLRAVAGNTDGNEGVDFDQLTSEVEFYDQSGVTMPSTAFSNRLKLAPPVFAARQGEGTDNS